MNSMEGERIWSRSPMSAVQIRKRHGIGLGYDATFHPQVLSERLPGSIQRSGPTVRDRST